MAHCRLAKSHPGCRVGKRWAQPALVSQGEPAPAHTGATAFQASTQPGTEPLQVGFEEDKGVYVQAEEEFGSLRKLL